MKFLSSHETVFAQRITYKYTFTNSPTEKNVE